MRIEKKTGNLGCFVCPLPVFFSLNYQLFLATLPTKKASMFPAKCNQTLTRFLLLAWLLAVEPKKFKSLSSKAKSLSINQPSTSSLEK